MYKELAQEGPFYYKIVKHMKFALTLAYSPDMTAKLSFISDYDKCIESFFAERDYGPDIKVLYIWLMCMNNQFAEFFPRGKPRYVLGGKRTMDDTEVVYTQKTFMYNLILEHKVYSNAPDLKSLLANDILASLSEISDFGRIKHFDLENFRNDLKACFTEIEWLSSEKYGDNI